MTTPSSSTGLTPRIHDLQPSSSSPSPAPSNSSFNPNEGTSSRPSQVILSLDQEIKLIRETDGDIGEAIVRFMNDMREDLKENSEGSKQLLMQLLKDYKSALESYHKTGLEPLQKQLENFGEDIQRNQYEYLDLTYGLGRFDEHDGLSQNDLKKRRDQAFPSNAPAIDLTKLKNDINLLIELYSGNDYERIKLLCEEAHSALSRLNTITYACEEIVEDQKNSARMSERLARRDLAETLLDSDEGEELSESFDSCLKDCKDACDAFLSIINRQAFSNLQVHEVRQEYFHTEECLKTLENLQKAFKEALPILDTMIEIYGDEKNREKLQRQRPDDPWNESKVFALETELKRIGRLHAWILNFSTQSETLIAEIESYSDNFQEERDRASDVENKGKSLIKELRIIKSKLRHPDQTKSKILSLQKDPNYDSDVSSELTKMIRLIRKKDLTLEISVTHYDLIRAEFIRKQAELHSEIEAGKCVEDLIDLYIELVRLERKYTEFRNIKDKIAKQFVDRIGRIATDQLGEAAFAFTADQVFHSHIARRHPLDSPLIEVIHGLANSGIGTSQWKNFLLLTDRPISHFERGIFQVLNKNIDRFISDRGAYFTASHEQSASLTRELPPKQNKDPDYYKAFDVSSIKPIGAGVILNPSTINLYGLLTMHLAYEFIDNKKREQHGLPPGHPLASLLVSSSGQILSWGINTINESKDPVRHAEINNLTSYFLHNSGMPIPEGSVFFTSLKPCHMCAGGIHDAGYGGLKVYYGQNDPGQPNRDEHRQLDSDVIEQIDAQYKLLKKSDPTLNAAGSLIHLREFAATVKEKLFNLGQENPECFAHIQDFLRYAVGEEIHTINS